MSDNSSSASNSSLGFLDNCLSYDILTPLGIVFNAARFTVVFPFSIYILYVGYQRWRQRGSFAALSHEEIISFQLAGIELLWIFGSSLYFAGHICNVSVILKFGFYLYLVAYYEENFCHMLICLERYLAVVYPITYMRIRKTPGVTIRNVSIACAWLFSCLWSSLAFVKSLFVYSFLYYIPLIFCVTITSFCSFSILRVLNRPGPGVRGQDKEKVGQSKRKAYMTVVGLMAVQWLWFSSIIFNIIIDSIFPVPSKVMCVVKLLAFWFNLPSFLVSVLLYLHREGKLSCWCPNCE